MEKGAGRGGKWSDDFDFAGILDPETGKSGRPFSAVSCSFFHAIITTHFHLYLL
ncbi:MAG: hypothetical protein HFG55_13475 [Lachnospiraceae bacterium]|nr:hypothetical protein [Lachnospiraceae bacterium]